MVVTGVGLCTGNPQLSAEKRIRASGFGRFDECYYLEKVIHEMDKGSGYKCSFDITSVRPDSAEQYRQDLYDYKEKKT